MQDVYEAHRPLKNLIASYRLEDVLGVVRAYSQNLAYNATFPADIEVLSFYRDPAAGVRQWELELIAREAIAYSQQYLVTHKTLKRANSLATLLNKVRDLDNLIAASVINENNVLTELHRMGHRQFEWQSDMPSASMMLRYYKIFSEPDMDAIVREQIGLDSRTIYLVGLLLAGFYVHTFALNYPPTFQLPSKHHITMQDLDAFLAHFALPIGDLSRCTRDDTARNMNENFAYFFNSLRVYPLIEIPISGKRSFVAPLPVLITWRFTRGLYYELHDHHSFATAFGSAFQKYVGEVLTDLFAGSCYSVLPEDPTANNRGVSSSDWFLVVGDSALAIEAKTKRMGLAAKISLNDTVQLHSELGKLADGVLQSYKCIDAIKKGKIGGREYAVLADKRLYPVIVTLESWHIFGQTWRRLQDLVKQRLHSAKLPVQWVETMPFSACDIGDFERLIQTIQASGSIGGILDERLNSDELQEYELYSYLYHHRKSALDQARELFPGQFMNMLN